MAAFITSLVPLVVLAAIVVAGLVLVTTRNPYVALPVLLDFLLAAGLLRLSATASWGAIGGAALVIAIRKVAGIGIRAGRRARRNAPAAP